MTTKNRQAPKGILGFPVAPMDSEGNLDLEGLGKNIEFLVEEGLTSVFVACGAGELHAISNEEYRSIWLKWLLKRQKEKSPSIQVLVEILRTHWSRRKFPQSWADGYLILPPYLIDPSQDGL